MELEIELEEELDLSDFCNWLILRMEKYLRDNIDIRKLVYFDEYLNSDNVMKWRIPKSNQTLSAYNILLSGVFGYMFYNDPSRNYKLGVQLFEGIGVNKDINKGIELLQKAAENNNAEAQYYLGQVFEKGKDIPQELIRWFYL